MMTVCSHYNTCACHLHCISALPKSVSTKKVQVALKRPGSIALTVIGWTNLIHKAIVIRRIGVSD